jgi:hypothetical protein
MKIIGPLTDINAPIIIGTLPVNILVFFFYFFYTVEVSDNWRERARRDTTTRDNDK